MELAVLFLGTSGSVPTPQRGLSATLMQRGGDRLLIDCGEGTQRQLVRAGVGMNQISRIYLTHLHADHYLGLPGMLKTWDLWGREEPVEVLGPRGLIDTMEAIKRLLGRFSFQVRFAELAPGDVAEFGDYRVVALKTIHRVPSLGYAVIEPARPGRFDPERAVALGVKPGPDFGRLQRGEPIVTPGGTVLPDQVMGEARPGRTVVFSGDTRPCPTIAEAASDADLLVHEATFTTEALDRALETEHSTAAEAAQLARSAGVRLLAITHMSFRHAPRDILAEAREHFERVVMPSDLDRLVVPYRDKGEAVLERLEGGQFRALKPADRSGERSAPGEHPPRGSGASPRGRLEESGHAGD